MREPPNDPKLRDSGGRRGSCMAGERRRLEAATVTPGAVLCSIRRCGCLEGCSHLREIALPVAAHCPATVAHTQRNAAYLSRYEAGSEVAGDRAAPNNPASDSVAVGIAVLGGDYQDQARKGNGTPNPFGNSSGNRRRRKWLKRAAAK